MKASSAAPVLFVWIFSGTYCASAFVANTNNGGKQFGGVIKAGSRSCSCGPSSPSTIYNARVDSSEAVADALRISRQKGTASPEARVAWDIVEELDASDNSVAYKIQPARPDHTDDYRNQIRAFAALMTETKEKFKEMSRLAEQLKELELTDPSLTSLGSNPEAVGIRRALSEAKAAQDVYGPHSPEADAAWDALEGCFNEEECPVESNGRYRYSAAALRAHHNYDAVVDAKLLHEAIAAFESIESLGKFIKLEKKRIDKAECIGALTTGDIPYLSVANYSHISALLNEECLLP